MTVFEEVRELVSVPAAAGHYGLEIRRGNMCLCPFHMERTPSMKLYERNYHCFGRRNIRKYPQCAYSAGKCRQYRQAIQK